MLRNVKICRVKGSKKDLLRSSNNNEIWPTINVDEEECKETGAEEAEVSSTRGNTEAKHRMHATLKTYELRLA